MDAIEGGDDGAGDGDDNEDHLDFKSMKSEVLYPYLINLLFEPLIAEMESITMEQIKFKFWDHNKADLDLGICKKFFEN